jgi:subtilisin family serine protease
MPRFFALGLLILLLVAAPARAADPPRGEQWNLDLIEADAAHAVTTSAGAVVAVVDSGVQANHPDLAAATVVARLTRYGRRLAAFRARVRVRLPGERKWRVRRVVVRS